MEASAVVDEYAEAERRLGRKLTDGERHVDILGIDLALAEGKRELRDAIEAEKRRYIDALVSGRFPSPMAITLRMRRAIGKLFDAGREFALREMRSMGVEPNREFAITDPLLRPELAPLLGYLGGGLVGIERRVAVESTSVDFGVLPARYVATVIDQRAPGALDLASRLVSSSLYGGIGDVYSANAGLFPGWTYSAVMDTGTCANCRSKDGTIYPTWTAAMDDLPNGGPNPGCYGNGRCRCRLVPVPPVAPESEPGVEPEPEPPPEFPDTPIGRIQRAQYDYDPLGVTFRSGESVRDLMNREPDLFGKSGYASPDVRRREEQIRAIGERVAEAVDLRTRAAGLRPLVEIEAEVAKRQTAYHRARRKYLVQQNDLREEIAKKKYPGRSIDDLSDDEWNALEDLTEAQIERNRKAADRAMDRLNEIYEEQTKTRAAIGVARREGIREVLEESGVSFGGDLGATMRPLSKPGSQNATHVLNDAAEWMPSRWVDASNGYSKKIVVSLEDRGFYKDIDLSPSGGTRSQIAISNRKGAAPDMPPGWATAVHELGHRMESVMPEIKFWEWVFHTRRTILSPDPANRSRQSMQTLRPSGGYRDDEWTYEDEFLDPYFGKDYGNQPGSPSEILSMGLESLFDGAYDVWEKDTDLRDFILGLLSSVGERQAATGIVRRSVDDVAPSAPAAGPPVKLATLDVGDTFVYAGHRFRVGKILSDREVEVVHVASKTKQRTSRLIDVEAVKPKPAGPERLVGRKAETKLNDLHRGAVDRLTDNELRDLTNYVGVSYRTINAALRRGNPLGGVSAKRVANIDSAIEKATPLDEEVVLWRGLNSWRSALGNATDLDDLVGRVVVDNGYASTTTRQSIAHGSVGKGGPNAAILRVVAPKGQKGAWISGWAKPKSALNDPRSTVRGIDHLLASDEGEFLLPRGTRFRVVSVKKGQRPEITVEIVP